MIRPWLVSIALLASGAAHAGPEARPEARPAAAPPPDGTGELARPAVVDKRRIIGILEVRVDGVPDDIRESFQKGIEEKFDAARYRLANHARVKQMMMGSTRWTEGCVVGQCLAEVRTQTGAELVLLAALTGAGTSFGYVVTLVRTDTGRVLRQSTERCDVCTVNEAMSRAMRATVDLLDAVPDKLPDEVAEQTANLDRAVGAVKQEVAARDRRNSRLGIALAVVGLAAAVGGGALYSHDHETYAAMIMAGGGAALASGVVVLTF
ncbi:MAG TPA: hypothetical protein VLM79_07380 [Kofleriaceae bacterium]|nr:hypothetical protein [Kofleriaceae bacterium]